MTTKEKIKSVSADHPTIENCTVMVFGAGVETWTADHGRVDEKGRRVGGAIYIHPDGSSFEVRVHATRDGVTFGALRRGSWCASLEEARALATAKLLRQRSQFKRKFTEHR